jgi:OHCU decarboxylase
VPRQLTVEEASRLSEDAFMRHFGGLYEHSPWVAVGAWRRRPFDSLEDLRDAFERTVSDAPAERRLALIRSHPELAGREAGEGTLTAESSGEQASAGLNRLSAEEVAGLAQLNAAYQEKFGFPMVVAVREHTKASIFAQAKARLAKPRDQELAHALDQIFRIAGLRLRELVADSDREGNTT